VFYIRKNAANGETEMAFTEHQKNLITADNGGTGFPAETWAEYEAAVGAGDCEVDWDALQEARPEIT
jgi:hypothetical protein